MHLTFWEDPDFVWNDFDNFYWKICNLEWFLYAMFRINFPKPPVTHTNYLLLAVNTIWISCELMELKSHMWALNLDSKAGGQRLNVIHTFSRLIMVPHNLWNCTLLVSYRDCVECFKFNSGLSGGIHAIHKDLQRYFYLLCVDFWGCIEDAFVPVGPHSSPRC